MLTSIQSTGVAPEVNLRTSTQARKHASEKSTLALKPRVDITSSPKQGCQWPHKKDLWMNKLNTLGPTDKEFGYNEQWSRLLQANTFALKSLTAMLKSSVTTNTLIQQAVYLLVLRGTQCICSFWAGPSVFACSKRDPMYLLVLSRTQCICLF